MRGIAIGATLILGLLGLMSGITAHPTPGTITPREAASHLGQSVTVEGVANIHVSPKAAFLDMGSSYPYQDFTAVIGLENKDQFGDLESYYGKTVDVTGTVQEYRGRPEIIVREKNQLRAQ